VVSRRFKLFLVINNRKVYILVSMDYFYKYNKVMYMELLKIAKELEGLQTVNSIAKQLNVDRRTSINYAWALRKKGFLENVYGGRVKLYRINPLIKRKTGYSFYELLNKYSKVKLAVREDYIIHSEKEPSVEEILVRAVKNDNFRVVLASLGLFNKIRSWSRLYKFAKNYNVRRKIGALYDVAREIIRVRRMDDKTRKWLLNAKNEEIYIIPRFKSKSFQDIEKKWNIFIPFNKADLEVYKE